MIIIHSNLKIGLFFWRWGRKRKTEERSRYFGAFNIEGRGGWQNLRL